MDEQEKKNQQGEQDQGGQKPEEGGEQASA